MLAAMHAPGPSFILPEFQPPQLYNRPAFRPDAQAGIVLPRLHMLQPQPTAPFVVSTSQASSFNTPVALPLVTAAAPRPEPTESSFDRLRSAPALPGLASLAALASSQRAAVTEESPRPNKVHMTTSRAVFLTRPQQATVPRKKKKKTPEQLVGMHCHECGIESSPEWRRGDDGPKTYAACPLPYWRIS